MARSYELACGSCSRVPGSASYEVGEGRGKRPFLTRRRCFSGARERGAWRTREDPATRSVGADKCANAGEDPAQVAGRGMSAHTSIQFMQGEEPLAHPEQSWRATDAGTPALVR
jgi:hypothetical protein